jgi:hypothetical protein
MNFILDEFIVVFLWLSVTEIFQYLMLFFNITAKARFLIAIIILILTTYIYHNKYSNGSFSSKGNKNINL